MTNQRYTLWLWEESGDMFIYNLGKHEARGNLDEQYVPQGAVMLAYDIMGLHHSEFVRSDNPCWQVHKSGEITFRHASPPESSDGEATTGA
jgi:hypothetical protein